MSVLSTQKRAALVCGIAGAGTATLLLLLRRLFRTQAGELDHPVSHSTGQRRESASCRPSLRARVGNFKVSKLRRLVEGVAEDLHTQCEFDWEEARVVKSDAAEQSILNSTETEWERQVNQEQRMFMEAARILDAVYSTGTHKKLPHFHIVDRELKLLRDQFREVGEQVVEFAWRENRDQPLADLMKLPFMHLASDESNSLLLPISRGLVKKTVEERGGQDSSEKADDRKEDLAMLGVEVDADRPALESAFRKRARSMHTHGKCTDLQAFHRLSNAYERCLAGLRESGWRTAYADGGDILSHYLLIGTDPCESRYGEACTGILDALQRQRLLARVDVLLSWGEASGSATGLGNG